MKKRKLGAKGPEVSAIGLGCMSFGGIFGATDESESFACLDAAVDQGIDFLDTSNIYGQGLSETVIGNWLKARKPAVRVATKGGIFPSPETPSDTRYFDNSPEALTVALDASLRRLGVDRIDLYYVHRREQARPIEEVTETLAGFRRAGKIGDFGFSEISPASLRRAAAVHPVAAVQNEYSLWSRQPELGLVRTCAELGTALVAFSPLARGMISDAPPDPRQMVSADFRASNPRFVEPNLSANRKIIDGFRDFAHARGWTTSAAALAWCLDQGNHIIPIPGTRNAKHLREWAGADEIRLTDEDRAAIDKILPVGFAHGDRYSDQQIMGVERYC